MKSTHLGSLIGISLLAWGSGALAADPAKSAALSGKDKQFVTKAAQVGLAEVATGKLALSKSQNADVKAFAMKMIDDHTKANQQLEQLASSKGITLPAAPDPAHQMVAQRLGGLQGAEFDKMYSMEAGSKDHQAAVNLFTSEAKRGKDADFKNFAGQTLPTLKEHQQMAQDLVRKVAAGQSQKSAAIQNQPNTTVGPAPQTPAVPDKAAKPSG